MDHKQSIRSCILMCSCLLALPSGWDALTCCRRDLINGSTSCQLNDAPDPTCDTEWIADGVMVMDMTGEMDPTRVQHAEPQTLVLKEKHTEIIFQMDCASTKGVTVVDETGETVLTRVQHAEPQTVILKERHTEINFQMECAATKNLVKLSCNDLCPSSDELTTATESQRTNNAGNKSTNDGVFIILSIIIIIIFTVT